VAGKEGKVTWERVGTFAMIAAVVLAGVAVVATFVPKPEEPGDEAEAA
jgi:hypothetical protein